MKNSKKIIGAIVLILALAVAGGFFLFNSWASPYDSNNTSEQLIDIPQGSSTYDIGYILEEKGIIKDAKGFRYYSKIKGFDGKFLAGKYALSPSMSADEIANILISGKTSANFATIPEGYHVNQIAEALEKQGVVSAKDFLYEAEHGKFDYDFIDDSIKGPERLEGFLFPDTYQFETGADAHAVIDTMLKNFDGKFTKEYRNKAKKMGYSVREMVTIASIIERETQKSDERPKVASVIYNRLEIDMPLQMCSTVQFILGEQKAVLSEADTRLESPYNTYLYGGLPEGPICSPGLESIKAALNPADTNYLYFVVSEKLDGSQNFSSDYQKFEKDKEAYYKAYEEKNGQ